VPEPIYHICENCNTSFLIKHHDKRRPQRFCCLSCANSGPNLKLRKRKPRQSAECGIDFIVRPSDAKRFCGHSCAETHLNKERGYKTRNKLPTCVVCGQPNKKNGMKFCSHYCHRKYQYDESVRLWQLGILVPLKNGRTPNFIKQYMREKHQNRCQLCGWSRANPVTGRITVQVHHIDGDGTNHIESNLELLCTNCHTLTPTYGSLNNGKGREHRRKYRKLLKEESG
jgi:hypothetical protein